MTKFVQVSSWHDVQKERETCEGGTPIQRHVINATLIASMVDDVGSSPRATRIYVTGPGVLGFTEKSYFDVNESVAEILNQL